MAKLGSVNLFFFRKNNIEERRRTEYDVGKWETKQRTHSLNFDHRKRWSLAVNHPSPPSSTSSNCCKKNSHCSHYRAPPSPFVTGNKMNAGNHQQLLSPSLAVRWPVCTIAGIIIPLPLRFPFLFLPKISPQIPLFPFFFSLNSISPKA